MDRQSFSNSPSNSSSPVDLGLSLRSHEGSTSSTLSDANSGDITSTQVLSDITALFEQRMEVGKNSHQNGAQ